MRLFFICVKSACSVRGTLYIQMPYLNHKGGSTMYFNQPTYGSAQIIRVNGENGARAYQMPPNSSTLLLDETAPIVWLKQTDGAGYPSITPYKIEPYQPEPAANYNDLAARISALEEAINVKSNSTNARRKTDE